MGCKDCTYAKWTKTHGYIGIYITCELLSKKPIMPVEACYFRSPKTDNHSGAGAKQHKALKR